MDSFRYEEYNKACKITQNVHQIVTVTTLDNDSYSLTPGVEGPVCSCSFVDGSERWVKD